jgi:hypothetical protein
MLKYLFFLNKKLIAAGTMFDVFVQNKLDLTDPIAAQRSTVYQ